MTGIAVTDVALASTWFALGLLAWRVVRLERRGTAAPAAVPTVPDTAPGVSGMRRSVEFRAKRTWGDPPPLPQPNPAAYVSAGALHPLPPVPTEQAYRARTRVWRRCGGGWGRSE